MAEEITYTVQFDDDDKIEVGSLQHVVVPNGLSVGTHSITITGKCQHGNEVHTVGSFLVVEPTCYFIIEFSQPHNTLPEKNSNNTAIPGTLSKIDETGTKWKWEYTPTGINDSSLNSGFYGYFSSSLDPNIKIINGEIDGVSSAQFLLAQCNSLTAVTLSLKSVQNGAYMFDCDGGSLTSVNLTNTDRLETCHQFFYGQEKLEEAPLFNMENVTTAYAMFGHCYSLKSTPAYNTGKLTDTSYMFIDCPSLETVGLFDTSHVTDARYMFYIHSECTFEYSQMTLPNFDFSSVTQIDPFCQHHQGLIAIPDLTFSNTVENVSYLFDQCINVKSGALSLYNKIKDLPNITNHSSTFNAGKTPTDPPVFASETIQQELEQIPASWGGLLTSSTN